jgi:hypothetical protein
MTDIKMLQIDYKNFVHLEDIAKNMLKERKKERTALAMVNKEQEK